MDYAYIAKFYNHDGPINLAAAFGTTRANINGVYQFMKMNREVEFYKSLWDKSNVNFKKELVR
jgi:hypothetical protein